MGSPEIPFNKPFIVGKELFYISQAVMDGHLAGAGSFARRCQEWLQRTTGAERVFLTHSCTGALEMAAILCNLEAGDEVVMPSYTFVTVASSFLREGARPVFVDLRPDTLNLDEEALEDRLTDRTKAVVAVHYAGVGCEMDRILDIAAGRDVIVVEDAAQGVCASYRGRPLGSMGSLGCYSFHETKNLISGEGGALLVNDPTLVDRAEIILEKGTDRRAFLRGRVDKYSWVDLGSSFQPSELVAAFLFAQLEEAERTTARRRRIFSYYLEAFRELQDAGKVGLPSVPEHCHHNGHMFYLLMPSTRARDELIDSLRREGIQAVFHYVPLHTSPMGQQLGYRPGDFPVTEKLSNRVLRLPCYLELRRDEQDRVVDVVRRFFKASA